VKALKMSDEWEVNNSGEDLAAGGDGESPKNDSGCRKCGEDGHFARECPNAEPDKCRKCKEEGHMARDCPLPDTCRRCGEEGHMAKDCTEEEKTRTVTNEEGEVKEIYVPREVTEEELSEIGISSGINFSKYQNIPVDVKGEKLPNPIKTFEEGNLRSLLLTNISKGKVKFTTPTPIQKYSIPIIMANRDLMASAQTGSGKTAAFLIPVIHNLLVSQPETGSGLPTQTPQALIITPTRELAIQIEGHAKRLLSGSCLKSVCAYGGTSTGWSRRQLSNGCNVLVATPGRLLDFVEKGHISFSQLKYFILDEADRMLDMGFGPEIEKCMSNPTMPPKTDRNTLMFSATFPRDVQQKANEYLRKDRITVHVGMIGAACSDVSQQFIQAERKEKKNELMKIIDAEDRDPSERVLIFVNTKKQADFLATFLSGSGKPATTIHGDRLQREREEVLHDFKTGKKPICVATAVAARGLDIPNVQKVMNYDLPSDVDEYVHRIGRTGRNGNLGAAISFYDPESDSGVVGPLCKMLSDCGVSLPDFMSGEGAEEPAGGQAEEEEDEW